MTQLKVEICEQQLQAWFGDVGGVAPDAGRLSDQSSLLENRGSIQELYHVGNVKTLAELQISLKGTRH